MKYRFIYKNDGWWLKVSTVEELYDYHNNVESSRMAKGFENYLCSTDFFETGNKSANSLGYLIGLRTNKSTCKSAIDITCDIQYEKYKSQLEYLVKGYNIYINRYGGWHFGKNDFNQWVDRNKIIFPNFTKDKIKIEKFSGGNHFYVYIDDMQVRDGDTLKWNTYEEAYNHAIKYINEV